MLDLNVSGSYNNVEVINVGLEKINEIRKIKGVGIDELVELSGVPKGTLSKITAGITTNPTLDTVRAIANALGCKLDDFDDNSQYKTKPATDNGSGLDENEQALVNTYRDMTPKGQKVLLETAETLHGNFKKNNIVSDENCVG